MLTIDAGTRAASDERLLAWLRDHGIEPTDTFRVEIHGDEVTVYQYLRDAEGQEFVRSDGEVAVRDPFTVQLTESAPDIETTGILSDRDPRRVAV